MEKYYFGRSEGLGFPCDYSQTICSTDARVLDLRRMAGLPGKRNEFITYWFMTAAATTSPANSRGHHSKKIMLRPRIKDRSLSIFTKTSCVHYSRYHDMEEAAATNTGHMQSITSSLVRTRRYLPLININVTVIM